MADLESAALSGALFRAPSHSPHRQTSPTPSSASNSDSDSHASPSELSRPCSPLTRRSRPAHPNIPVHDGAQTGPKGVLSDRRAVDRHQVDEGRAVRREMREGGERGGVGGMTWEEEEKSRAEEAKEGGRAGRGEEGRGQGNGKEDGNGARDGDGDGDGDGNVERWRRARRKELEGGVKRSGLREVGKEGFVLAVEKKGWVVVLIYEPDMPRCQALLASMLHLSLNLPSSPTPISLFRARATSLAFSLLPPDSHPSTNAADDDDREADHYDDDEEAHRPAPRGRPDPDVLPTMLAYRDGELEKTWIRVDWEVGEDGVEGLLRREGVLPPSEGGRQNLMDEEDD